MCEMKLWLKHLNKQIALYWDGLATVIISQRSGMHTWVASLSSLNVSYYISNSPFMWILSTKIHVTFILQHTPPSKWESLLAPLRFASNAHQGNPGGISRTKTYYTQRKAVCFLCLHSEFLLRTRWAESGWWCMCLQIQRICYLLSDSQKPAQTRLWKIHADETGYIRS